MRTNKPDLASASGSQGDKPDAGEIHCRVARQESGPLLCGGPAEAAQPNGGSPVRGPFRRATRGLRSRIGVAVIILAGLVSAGCFAAVSLTVNGVPSTTPFSGFVTVLQPAATSISQDQIKLIASPLVPGGPGQHPGLSYAVAVCGPQPFRGVLLIGGDARLSHLKATPALGNSATEDSGARNLPSLTILDEGSDAELDLGPVQAIRFTMNHPEKCVSRYAADEQPPPTFLGQSQVITGQPAAPVQRLWHLGWWSGPRNSQSWPLIGNLPGISPNDLGEFQALTGLSGAWNRPLRQYTTVSAGGLLPRAIVDQAQPQLASSTVLNWDSAQPIEPSATVTDTASMNIWQNWLVAAGIFLGIGGSLLASLLYDWARPRSTDPQQSSSAGPRQSSLPSQPLQQRTGHQATVAAAGALLLAWVLISRRRRT